MKATIVRRAAVGGAVAALVAWSQLGTGGVVPTGHTVGTGELTLAGGGPTGGPWYMQGDGTPCSASNDTAAEGLVDSHLSAPVSFEVTQAPAGTVAFQVVIGETFIAVPDGGLGDTNGDAGHITRAASYLWKCADLGDADVNTDGEGLELPWALDALDENDDPLQTLDGTMLMTGAD